MLREIVEAKQVEVLKDREPSVGFTSLNLISANFTGGLHYKDGKFIAYLESRGPWTVLLREKTYNSIKDVKKAFLAKGATIDPGDINKLEAEIKERG